MRVLDVFATPFSRFEKWAWGVVNANRTRFFFLEKVLHRPVLSRLGNETRPSRFKIWVGTFETEREGEGNGVVVSGEDDG
jgi:hypothetical protein